MPLVKRATLRRYSASGGRLARWVVPRNPRDSRDAPTSAAPLCETRATRGGLVVWESMRGFLVGLAVRPDHVVQLGEPSSGRFFGEGAVWSRPVIELQPAGKCRGAFGR